MEITNQEVYEKIFTKGYKKVDFYIYSTESNGRFVKDVQKLLDEKNIGTQVIIKVEDGKVYQNIHSIGNCFSLDYELMRWSDLSTIKTKHKCLKIDDTNYPPEKVVDALLSDYETITNDSFQIMTAPAMPSELIEQMIRKEREEIIEKTIKNETNQ